MRAKILYLYILGEIIRPFIVYLLIGTFVFMMFAIMDVINLVLVKGVSLKDIGLVISLMMPKTMGYTIPLASLLAVLTGFLRLSSDSELTVIRASGLSLSQLLPPVMVFALAVALITGAISLYLAPWANWRYRQESLNLAKAVADRYIKEQVFVRFFPGLVIYVGHIPLGGDRMEDVFIKDERPAGTAADPARPANEPDQMFSTSINAESGYLVTDPEQGVLVFQLENGIIDRINLNNQTSNSINFDRYELKISPGVDLNDQNRNLNNRKEIPTSAIIAQAALRAENQRNPAIARTFYMEWHRRAAVGVSCLVFSFIGLPLGAGFRPRGRNFFGLILGIMVFLIYNAFHTICWSLGENGLIAPYLAMWLPNGLILIAALSLFRVVNRGAAIEPAEVLRFLAGLLKKAPKKRQPETRRRVKPC